jgi:hypothetical protein
MPVIINGTTGVTFPNGVTMSDGTSAPVTAAQGGTGLSSVGTAGNVLTSNGTTWVSQAAAAFDAGTVMLFAQTSAPTGWTKNTSTGNNSALRVVTGTASTGGSVAFTTAFASQTPAGSVSINTSGLSAGATTLSTTQIPSHSHTSQRNQADFGGVPVFAQGEPGATTINTGNTGGGGSHTHTVSGSATGSFTGTAIDLAVQYIDVIRATKN